MVQYWLAGHWGFPQMVEWLFGGTFFSSRNVNQQSLGFDSETNLLDKSIDRFLFIQSQVSQRLELIDLILVCIFCGEILN